MYAKTIQEAMERLAEPFPPSDIEWRMQQKSTQNMKALAVPYLTNRAVQARLDEVFGPFGWENEYKEWKAIRPDISEGIIFTASKDADPAKDQKAVKNFMDDYYGHSQLCGISIKNPETNEFITKWDGAEDTDIEPTKGGLSDSMKRAGVQWGIGRYLYEIETKWVEIEKKGYNYEFTQAALNELKKIYSEYVQNKKTKAKNTLKSASKAENDSSQKENSNSDQLDSKRKNSSQLPMRDETTQNKSLENSSDLSKESKQDISKEASRPIVTIKAIKPVQGKNGGSGVKFVASDNNTYFAQDNLDKFIVGAEIDLATAKIQEVNGSKIIQLLAS
jgi:hypothetical protein